MKMQHSTRSRKGVAGIIAAVLMFAMLFTVGTSYLLFENTNYKNYVTNLASRSNNVQNQFGESLLVTPVLSGSNIAFYANNTGSLNVNITAVFLLDSSGNILKCEGVGLPSGQGCGNTIPTLWKVVNVGKGSPPTGTFDTGYAYVSGTLTVKVMTARGSAFTQTYPVTSSASPVSNALNAGAIGDLYLSWTSFKSWTIKTSGCSSAGDLSGYCLNVASDGFSVPVTNQCYSTYYCNIFSVRITNLNQQHYSIQLSQFSLFYQLYSSGASGKAGYYPWYIVSNSSGNIYKHFHVINLTYNQPQTIIFAASACLAASSGPSLSTCTLTVTGTNWLVEEGTTCSDQNINHAPSVVPCGMLGVSFINPNGWELASPASTHQPGALSYTTLNYAQNLGFISTLYT